MTHHHHHHNKAAPPGPLFGKGQSVQYITKTGELTPAKVLQVDYSIFPCQVRCKLCATPFYCFTEFRLLGLQRLCMRAWCKVQPPGSLHSFTPAHSDIVEVIRAGPSTALASPSRPSRPVPIQPSCPPMCVTPTPLLFLSVSPAIFVLPFCWLQYAIQLEGQDGERWTEENRLRPAPEPSQ